jgi:tetratricopeptide (TPR) repeat protein
MRKFAMGRTSLALCAAAFILWSGYACLLAAPDEGITQIEGLIQDKQIATAEKMIVGKLVADPRNTELITLLAEVRFDQRRYKEAMQLVDDADAVAGPTAKGTTLRGLVAVAQSRLDLAEPRFQEAIRLDPNYAFAHYYLSRLLYTRNHFNESIQESNAAIALAPNLVRAYENLGLCYEAKQQIDEAKKWYLEAVQRGASGGRQTEWPSLDLATMLIRNGRVEEARPYLLDALKLNPNNSKSHLQMAIVLEKTGDLAGALQELQRTVNLDPTQADAHYRVARIYQKLGKKDLADKEFAQFQRISEAQRRPIIEQAPGELLGHAGENHE